MGRSLKRLRAHGSQFVVEPESFLVTNENHLDDDELEHARGVGDLLVASALSAT